MNFDDFNRKFSGIFIQNTTESRVELKQKKKKRSIWIESNLQHLQNGGQSGGWMKQMATVEDRWPPFSATGKKEE